jgi:hypothetical protein
MMTQAIILSKFVLGITACVNADTMVATGTGYTISHLQRI